METVLDHEKRIKQLFKEALVESIEEPRGILQKLFAEVREDIALARAIGQAKDSPDVSRDEIFRILEGKA